MLNLKPEERIDNPGRDPGGPMPPAKNVSGEGILQSLSVDQQKGLTLVFMLIEEFRKIRPTMPISHAFAYLLVAQEEGLTVNAYAQRANVGQTVMTRWLFDIGSHSRTRDPGYGLVMQRSDPNDLRKHQTFLTDAGRTLAHSLNRVLRMRAA